MRAGDGMEGMGADVGEEVVDDWKKEERGGCEEEGEDHAKYVQSMYWIASSEAVI